MTAMEQILAIVESIPAGRVTTYGSIADVVEGATARSVGHALRTDGHAVPWWRVVTASGRPAPGAEHAAYERFLEEKTPVDTADDGTYSVDVAAAIWHIPSSPSLSAGRSGAVRAEDETGGATSTRTRQTRERQEMIEPRLGGRCTR
ncbi:hypothetical protein GCM10023203_17690 [Actinomycetospora straminea]|uniref:Methylated-DNA-[protein]-cysteine S-methyltransferase DNA binding domain-containing protein n=2 Tax=Actinomycetospora straminea TaxID=663607 RepID=A0ABP9E5N3_9PSEU